jgi:hypothetical protein
VLVLLGMLLAAACTPLGSPQPRAVQAVVGMTANAGETVVGMLIEEVVFERDGDPRGLRVAVRRDGHIEHTRVGHPRFGMVDETHVAQVTAQAFARLVDLLHEQRFFALQPVYDDPQLADGPWALVRVSFVQTGVRAEHEVWWREGHAPVAMQPVEEALRALGARALPASSPDAAPAPSAAPSTPPSPGPVRR